jgi:hypothetical protein
MTDRESKLFEVDVECYSGYKADEHPVSFSFNGFRFRIEEIIDRWHQAYSEPGSTAAEYFKVRTSDNKQYILKHEINPGRWYIRIKGESINLCF